MAFTQNSLRNLKDHIDIVEVVSGAIPLKKAGSNYKGVCPFHSEKTPSFTVSEQKQIFTCFGCGASGDAITFVERFYNLEFNEAVEKLAQEYGVTLEKSGRRDENLGEYYAINKDAAQYFYKNLTEKKNKGYSYAKSRDISPQIIKKFGLGYADEDWDSLYKYLSDKGYDKEKIKHLGLVTESNGKYYDKFRNRLIFPIINTSGKFIGFGGRAIDPDDNPKYLNSPESKIFYKKNNLFGLNFSRQSVGEEGFIILVEGYMDTIGLYQQGVTNVAASLGTALTDSQARLIKRYTNNVILSYDSDAAGRNAALRGMEILRSEGLKVRVMHVTDGKDPDEFIKKEGRQAFIELLDKALPYGDYRIESIISSHNIEDREERIDALKEIASALKKLGPVEREVYIERAAQRLNIGEAALRNEIDNIKDGHEKRPARVEKESGPAIEPDSLEKDLIRLITRDEGYLERIGKEDGIIESDAGLHILKAMEEEISEHNNLDIKRVMDILTDEERSILKEIIDTIPATGEEDDLFDDCLSRFRIKKLTKEKELLNSALTMADSSVTIDAQNNILRKISEIDKAILQERTRR